MSFTNHPDFAKALALAGQLADVARRIVLEHFRAPIAVEHKTDDTPVTVADRDIETQMRRMIRAAFPGHAVRGEEFAAEGSGEFTWVLDPIDGTKSFISGYPLFGSLIALQQGDRPVLGVIEAPVVAERWVGADGRATLFNGKPARARDCRALAEAILCTTTPETFEGSDWSRFEALSARTALRRFGGDCYLYGMLASGYCDLVVEAKLKPHDFMAVIPIVTGAGGRISDWRGEPLSAASDGRVVAACTEALWRQALDILR
ncbi:MAG TPA: histidinol-phosphatase [Steroidobacteraceae bacterium]|jgi:myo-inositol-1(or 4)-monophosphatase|nr:histidinol-phosphatase [Steroidobacteraceae bacterium]